MMGGGSIVEVFTCGDCGKTEQFRPGADLHNLTKGGWLVLPGVGGVGGVYCPECRKKYDEIENQKRGQRLIEDLRHRQALDEIESGQVKDFWGPGLMGSSLKRGIEG